MKRSQPARYIFIKWPRANNNMSYLILLTDPKFWDEHWNELNDWAREHGNRYQIVGSTIDVDDEEDLTLFALRWS